MRPIKFRVWDIKNKKFIYEYDARPKRLAISFDGKVYHGGYDDVLSTSDYIIQQYTGLKDKNGKEIYEGDILHYLFDGASYPKEAQDKYLTCVYDSDFGGFCFDDADSSYYWAEVRGYMEVIGNIFETPELLDKTKEL